MDLNVIQSCFCFTVCNKVEQSSKLFCVVSFSFLSYNGILFILNAVGKSEKSFPNEKEK